MKVEANHVELLTTIKIGTGDFIYKGQRFRKPFPDSIRKELMINPGIFKILDSDPVIQQNRIFSTPQFKHPVQTKIEPDEEEKKLIRKQGEAAVRKAEETREMIDRMAGDDEEKKPKKRKLSGK